MTSKFPMEHGPHHTLLDSLAKPPPEPSELDELMQRDPLELSAQDIDKIIAFQRQARARRESGIKPKRPKAATAPSGIDLVALVSGKSAPVKLAPQAATTVNPNKSFRRL